MRKFILVAGFALMALSGCVVAEEYAVPAPPPERVEVIAVAPYPKAIWVKGYWGWERRHRRYTWHEGYWSRHGHRDRYRRDYDGYRRDYYDGYRHGYYEDRWIVR